MERMISEFDEQVIRLIHHNFGGLTQQEAAKQLGVSQKKVSQAVSRLKRKVPQLFPLLTKEQKYVRDCIIGEGLSHLQIAVLMGKSKGTVDSIVATLKAKGICFNRPRRVVPYEPYHDEQTVRKF